MMVCESASRQPYSLTRTSVGSSWHIHAHHRHRCMPWTGNGIDHVGCVGQGDESKLTLMFRQDVQRWYPDAWMFTSCPPDPSVRCISPGFYAVVGAAAMLGGVTRMTSACLSLSEIAFTNRAIVSIVVILFEVRNASIVSMSPLTNPLEAHRRPLARRAHHGRRHDGQDGRRRAWVGRYLSRLDRVETIPMAPARGLQGQRRYWRELHA